MKSLHFFLKGLCVVLLTVSTAATALADPVDALRAGETARAFFKNDANAVRRMAPLTRVALYDAPLTKAGEQTPAFHIFNREGGGFVIIAGDDACKPVLAYSFDESFGDVASMPDGLRDWLSDFEDQVGVIRREGDRPAVEAWTAVLTRTKGGNDYKPAVEYATPVWNQNAPFNNLTPMSGSSHAVIGCVPLAMGMLMRFFGYPAKGEGYLPPYSYELDDGTLCSIEGFELGHPYEWDKIKFDYREGYTEEEGAAVARLVYDCGVAVQAKFAESTSANVPTMAGCAVDHFGFDPGAYYYKRELFTDAQWLDLLKGELQDHPVLYSARREGGGHAFLVDGYDQSGNVHVNWGWGGSSNGYYALSAFTPSTTRQYIYSHAATFGLVPKQGSSEKTKEYLYFQSGTSSSSGNVYNGLTPSGTIRTGEAFTMQVGFLYNGGIHSFEGQYFLALTDRDGAVVDAICPVKDIDVLKSGSGRGYTNIDCMMRAYPQEGEKIQLLYRSLDWPEGVWETPLFDRTSDIVAEIAVSDGTKLSDVTSVSYNKTSGEVTVETKDRVDWTLKSSSGTAVKEGIVYDFTTLKIPTEGLSKGAYSLTLKHNGEQVVVNLKMGNK